MKVLSVCLPLSFLLLVVAAPLWGQGSLPERPVRIVRGSEEGYGSEPNLLGVGDVAHLADHTLVLNFPVLKSSPWGETYYGYTPNFPPGGYEFVVVPGSSDKVYLGFIGGCKWAGMKRPVASNYDDWSGEKDQTTSNEITFFTENAVVKDSFTYEVLADTNDICFAVGNFVTLPPFSIKVSRIAPPPPPSVPPGAPKPVIVSSTGALSLGRIALGTSDSVGRVFNVRGEHLVDAISLSVAGVSGFLVIPERISRALASNVMGYDVTVIYNVSEAPGVSDLEGTLTLSSVGADDVSVVLQVSVVESDTLDPEPDPEPKPDPDPEPNPDPDPEPDPEPQMQFPFSVSDAGGAVLFPNPVGSILHIGRSESRERRAVVYTLRGRPVLRVTLDDWSSGLDVTALVPGAYVIKIETDIMSRYFVKK